MSAQRRGGEALQGRGEKVVRGGDWDGELDETELDKALMYISKDRDVKALPADTAVRGDIVKIKEIIAKNKTVFIPFWCRYHWTLTKVCNGYAELYDSAHSEAVHRDAKTWATKLGLKLLICPCPQQHRGTAECGVFVIGFMLALTHGRRMRIGKVSLHDVRNKLKKEACPKIEWFNDMLETKIAGGDLKDWVAEHNRLERRSAAKNLCYMLTATLTINVIHEEIGGPILDYDIPDLEKRVRRLGFTPGAQDDFMEAIERMVSKGVATARVIFASEIQTITDHNPWIAMWNSEDEADNTDISGWHVLAGIRFEGEVNDTAVGQQANGGHYQLTRGEGRFKIIRRMRQEESNTPRPKVVQRQQNKKAEETNVTKKPKETQPAAKKKTQPTSILKNPKRVTQAAPAPKRVTVRSESIESDNSVNALETNIRPQTEWINREEMAPLGTRPRGSTNLLCGAAGRFWYICTGRPRHVHLIAWKAVSNATRVKHQDWLHAIKAMPADLAKVPLGTAVIELVMRMSTARKWAWSTLSSALSTIHTAVKNLPLYTTEANGIDLKESAVFAEAMKRAQKNARTAGPDAQLSTPMSREDMMMLMQRCHDLPARTLLAASWYFAARVGDMRQVKPADFRLPAQQKEGEVTTVTFKLGKGGAIWGLFTIASVLPLDVVKDMAKMIHQRANAEHIWTERDQQQVSSMVSEIGLNLRSIRRGSLNDNADKGVEDQQLQLLSGHKRLDTLMRYLGWGVASSSAKQAAKERHKKLKGKGVPEPKKMSDHAGYQGDKGKRVSKPPTFFWHRPPTRCNLGLEKQHDNHLPLHIKSVGVADIESIRDLATGSRYEKPWSKAVTWLTGEPYEKLTCQPLPTLDKIPKAKFTEGQVKQLVRAHKLQPITQQEGLAFVNMFGNIDRDKDRIRVLAEPYVNNLLDPEVHYPPLGYQSRLERRAEILGMKYVMEFDYAAYFDQFNLDREARRFNVVRTNKLDGNELWAITRLPMGARYSPSIAQYTTWIICEPLTKIPGVVVTTMIDNVRIAAASREAFIRAVRLFLHRSEHAKLTLNMDKWNPQFTDKMFADLGAKNAQETFTFLGETYKGDKISNAPKLVQKLRDMHKHIKNNQATLRQMAALMGLMLFMSHTINIGLEEHFKLIRTYASWFRGTPEWDEPMEIETSLMENIDRLAEILLENNPVKIEPIKPPPTEAEEYDAIAIFDACQVAWAGRVHICNDKKTLRVMKAFASPLKHSAHAEPTAAKELPQWMKEQFPNVTRVALVTDHIALAKGQRRWWSGNGGFSTAYPINEAFRIINGFAEVFHVKGTDNPCDADSRSTEAAKSKDINVSEIQEVFPDLRNYEHPYLTRPVRCGF